MNSTAGSITFSNQTDLFYQHVVVSNSFNVTLNGILLTISNVPSGVTVWNAQGTNNNLPFVESIAPLAPGQAVTFTIEFFSPTRNPFSSPTYLASAFSAQPVADPGGTPQSVSRFELRDGTFLIEFPTLTNNIYFVQYSSNMVDWLTAVPALNGNGTFIQWLDLGPPKTISPPPTNGSRFYRVTFLPR
jgi:hypothetical protein